MNACPACSRPVPDGRSTCPACGAATDSLDTTRVTTPSGSSDLDATRVTPTSDAPPRPPDGERFPPGTILRDRYRVVALLGRGGMGEVYRADDLKLGQSVALKFLPPGLEDDPDRLRRFLDEVRTARQVSHSAVCRVHDVDEFDGQHFLSMEYVDGEDLGSLLRRIGRLPEERALEVARQICAGLAAAHDAGVLHRDLKPANVMIDGRGQVKLTDFGLASLIDATPTDEIRAGTPAYMAPEQLAGREVTRASDVYALGLVLYELFTGRAVYQATTIAELSALHASDAPSRPSDLVTSLDPAIESAVMRCLDRDPSRRPPTAVAVAAALPGGDPLAAALAAGETPSPELVAESGAREALRPAAAFGLAVGALVLVLGGSYWAATQSLIAYMPFEKRPEVLQDRALEILAEVGYTEPAYADPVDTAWGWLIWNDVIGQIEESGTGDDRWLAARDRPDVGAFWYRQSVAPMRPVPRDEPVLLRGQVSLVDPPATTPGAVSVVFDLDGSLRRFEVMPRRFAQEPPSEPDWMPLFEAAELDTARFRPVPPRYQRYMSPDLRRAWVGTLESAPDIDYRVEAGAAEGRPVLFNVTESRTLEDLGRAPSRWDPGLPSKILQGLPPLVILIVVLLISRVSRRNVDQRRADTRGAVRLAFFMGILFLVASGLRSHALTSWNFAGELWHLVVGASFIGLAMWGMYVAIEPVGRQVWPTMFVSSSRLLSLEHPSSRDPLVGRAVLAGLIVGGGLYTLLYPLLRTVRVMVQDTSPWLFGINVDMVHGGARALANVIDSPLVFAMAFLQVSALVLFQRAVGRRWLAAALAVVVWTLFDGFSGLESFLVALSTSAVLMVALLRWGIVTLVVTQITIGLAWHARAVDYGHWTSGGATMALVAVVVLALYGAWAATGSSRSTAR